MFSDKILAMTPKTALLLASVCLLLASCGAQRSVSSPTGSSINPNPVATGEYARGVPET